MSIELTILMPCLNEAETITTCINKAQAFLKQENITGEILIADNGSTDGSQKIARDLGATIVDIPVRGYGAALIGGIQAAQGKFIIMGDADDSYDFSNLMPFLVKLREGYDLVMGNRFKGGIQPGAMPFLNKYLGNPVLTWVGRLFFKSPIRDFHCGLRGFNKIAIQSLKLQTTGMEFASEMVVKANLNNLKVTEVPTTLAKDGRTRPPHLRPWRDGWRHLRFLLLFSPRWLFLYPGLALATIGLIGILLIMAGALQIGHFKLNINTMLYFGIFIIIGLQTMFFAIFAKTFSISLKLLPEDPKLNKLINFFSLEKCLMLGGILIILGLGGSLYALGLWEQVGFGSLDPLKVMPIVIPSAFSLAIGVQIIFSAFFLSVLRLPHSNT